MGEAERLRLEVEAAQKAADEAERLRLEEEAVRKAAEEAERLRLEEEAARKAVEEAQRLRLEEEAARKAAVEAESLRLEEDPSQKVSEESLREKEAAQEAADEAEGLRLEGGKCRGPVNLDMFFANDRCWQMVYQDVQLKESREIMNSMRRSQWFRVNVPENLRVKSQSLQYRNSKDLRDRCADKARNGSEVCGFVESDGKWLRLHDNRYLPMGVELTSSSEWVEVLI